jgi:arsenate reductase
VSPPDPARRPLGLDQELALRSAALRLEEEYDGLVDGRTVESFLASSYEQLADSARILTFVPLLAERFTRERLRAVVRLEGLAHHGTPVVLFLCTHNAARSQMAMAFLRHHAGDAAIAWSGGNEPSHEVDPVVLTAMAERGIDLSEEYPKPWTEEITAAADVVVTMECGDAYPERPERRHLDWDVPDPAGLGLDEVRPIRDDLERRVLDLARDLGIPLASPSPEGDA